MACSFSSTDSLAALGRTRLAAKCNLTRYAPRLRGPRKNQRIKPSTGSSATAIIQISFFSFEAELWKILIIAHISPVSIRRPKTPLYPKFIILVPSPIQWGLSISDAHYMRTLTVLIYSITGEIFLLGIFRGRIKKMPVARSTAG